MSFDHENTTYGSTDHDDNYLRTIKFH